MPAYEALARKQTELIRKALDGSVFYAPMSAPLPSTLTTGGNGATAEVQSVSITGGPTGGTFTLSLGGDTTTDIAYNATASAVQAAIAALSTVGTGNVTCTGGPLPTSSVTVTFAAAMGDVDQMTAIGSLTGGTTPAVTVSTTTPGVAGAAIELASLPVGYNDLGWIDKDDGVTWARETEVSEITSWGSFDPTRRDLNQDVTSVSLKAQETNLHTLGLYYNVDTATLTPDPVTGEVDFAQPTRPSTRYYRVFALFQDGVGDNTIWVARLLPRAMLSEPGEQTWSDGDEPVAYEMTLAATTDSTAGYSVRHLFGGPGWRALLSQMGFA